MKHNFILRKKNSFPHLIILSATLLCVSSGLFAQTDSTKTPVTDSTAVVAAAPVAEETSMISPMLEFKAVQKGDNTIDLKAGLKAKVKGWPLNLYKMKVAFFQVVNEEDKELGFVITDNNGKAIFNVKGDSLKTDNEGKLQFKAVFAGNKGMESAEEVVAFKKARLEITPVKEDSLLTVLVKLVDVGTGNETPVPEVAIGIFVKRLFLPLKIGEGTTDASGEATVEFPNNLPGDAKGKLTLIARLDENEMYGNLEASSDQPWGVPVSDIIKEQPRALWSSHPPLWMLITFIVLMVAVWGHFIFVVYELFRLKKEQPILPGNATKS